MWISSTEEHASLFTEPCCQPVVPTLGICWLDARVYNFSSLWSSLTRSLLVSLLSFTIYILVSHFYINPIYLNILILSIYLKLDELVKSANYSADKSESADGLEGIGNPHGSSGSVTSPCTFRKRGYLERRT